MGTTREASQHLSALKYDHIPRSPAIIPLTTRKKRLFESTRTISLFRSVKKAMTTRMIDMVIVRMAKPAKGLIFTNPSFSSTGADPHRSAARRAYANPDRSIRYFLREQTLSSLHSLEGWVNFPSSSFTTLLISAPDALPDNCFDKTPITFPNPFRSWAPT